MSTAISERRRTSNGRLWGRPRGDAAILAVLDSEGWTLARTVAERLQRPLGATHVALWRAQQRGLIERRRYGGGGYRLRQEAAL